jgi:glutathione peroxidase
MTRPRFTNTSPSKLVRRSRDIKWNFTKFLVDRNGNVVERFESAVTPDSKEVVSAVEKQLSQK